MVKRILCGIWALALAVSVFGQTSLNSPYSQHGMGLLSDGSQSFSRGMNGASLGVRQGNIINTQNPASYACVDSLTMLFDMGIAGQMTHFKETFNGVTKSKNGKNASFEYVVGSFRLFKNVGMTFGLLPFSNIGYKYSVTTTLDKTNGNVTETHEGSGGLHEVFIGAGWQVTKALSVGANIGYLWGSLDKSVVSSSTTYINSLSRSYTATVNSYKLDFGVQWQQPLSKSDLLTVGATVGVGHKLGADATCVMTNVSNAVGTSSTVTDALALPMTYGLGAAWRHGNSLLVDADVKMQNWGSVDFPGIGNDGKYALQSDLLKNRYQVNVGADYVPDPLSRKYLKRVHYKVGGGFTTPYYNINGQDGPKEFSISAGFGIPLQNSYNNRSVLNVSGQWVHRSATGMITENTFRINIGLTFNERWFAKWKVN
ncbi:MAG: hypothetical protein K6F43_06035 [Prevotella sp.]|nr:hypothetical protein [Prevotella sp.]